jgi:methylglutaconyl-CoA hydratase
MIKSEIKNNNGIIILNRPEKRNALNPEMISLFKTKLDEFRNNELIKTVIITGEGTSFCAGADISYLNELRNYSTVKNEEDTEKLADLFLMLYDFSKPVIAAVNGPAIAGGCGIASVCDFIIADKASAKFGYSEVKIGFIPAIVAIFLIKKIGEGKTRQLLLTGDIINSEKALQFGLVDYLSDNILDDAVTFADKLNENSTTSTIMTKDLIRNISNMKVHDAVNYCIRLNVISRSSDDFKKGINKILNKN